MRVNRVAKATGSSKLPWPEEGKSCMKCRTPIMKGEPYQWAQGFRGPKKIICGTCTFTRSDLTNSIKASIYDAFEGAIKELDGADEGSDFDSILQPIIDAVREVEDQYRSAADEYFSGGGPQAEMADECEAVADELESIDIPEILSEEDWNAQDDEDKEHDEYDEYVQERVSEFRDAIESADTL